MTPLSVGPRLAAAVMAAATKAHDEVLQGTQVPPPLGSHQRLLARCSLRISRHRQAATNVDDFVLGKRRMSRPMPADRRLLDNPGGQF
jgi:hypothetical protein